MAKLSTVIIKLTYNIRMSDLFIEPQCNINQHESPQWKHFANLSPEKIRQRWTTPEGKGHLKALKAGRFSRETLHRHAGKFADKYDLRGIPLSGENLEGADLSNIDFFNADLSHCNLAKATLSGSHLSQCDIRGTVFDWARLDNVLLDNATFNTETRFLGVNLHQVNFTLATLLYDLALSQQRIQQLHQHHPIFAMFLKYSCDYGRSFTRYFAWVCAFLILYAFIYSLLFPQPFIDCLYYSVATFATVGYGDIQPVTTLQKCLVISEIATGYLMGGLLVGILAKRVIG